MFNGFKRFRFGTRALFMFLILVSGFVGYVSMRLGEIALGHRIVASLGVSGTYGSGIRKAVNLHGPVTVPFKIASPSQPYPPGIAAITLDKLPPLLNSASFFASESARVKIIEVEIDAPQLDDTMFKRMASIPTLRSIVVHRSSVSDEGIEELLESSSEPYCWLHSASEAISYRTRTRLKTRNEHVRYRPKMPSAL